MKIHELEFEKYNHRQVREYIRFMEFIFVRQMDYLGDPLKAAILRAIYLEELEHDRSGNASSLARSLGIPRETVRRKAQKLIERGWLIADGSEYRLNRHFPDDFQDCRIHTTDPPPRELHPFRSHPMACF